MWFSKSNVQKLDTTLLEIDHNALRPEQTQQANNLMIVIFIRLSENVGNGAGRGWRDE